MMSHGKTDRLADFPFSDLSIRGDGYMKFETEEAAESSIMKNNESRKGHFPHSYLH